jgi:hypothetical protein
MLVKLSLPRPNQQSTTLTVSSDAPSALDADAPYSRFSYVDDAVTVYKRFSYFNVERQGA